MRIRRVGYGERKLSPHQLKGERSQFPLQCMQNLRYMFSELTSIADMQAWGDRVAWEKLVTAWAEWVAWAAS